MNPITNDLWIGDIHDARTKPLDEMDIDAVVTICEESVEENVSDALDYYHYTIQDGWPGKERPPERAAAVFNSAVDRIRASIEDGRTVFVHCHAGMSRSVSAVACVLACDHEYTLDEAYWHVRTHRDTNVHDHLRMLAGRYVKNQG